MIILKYKYWKNVSEFFKEFHEKLVNTHHFKIKTIMLEKGSFKG